MIGFVLVDKPPGPTSHDVVAIARRALRIKRVGHAGTLDPPASGLVVLGVGAATRLLSFVQRRTKTYETTGVLGVRTTTLDADGQVLSTTEPDADLDEARLRAAVQAYRGEIEQTPPAVSAVKVKGERAYKRAARGEDVQIEPRRVTIHDIELVSFDPPEFGLRVVCSSGTYIRSLVADIGDDLSCGAHVKTLRRTSIGSSSVDDAVPPDAISSGAVRPVEQELDDLPRIDVDADVAARLRNGQRVPAGPSDDVPEVLVVGPEGAIGIFESRAGTLRALTVLGS